MGKLILVFGALLLMSVQGYAKVKVAVIDTGIKDVKTTKIPLCKERHDFTGEGLEDVLGHGTNVSHLIHANAGNADYCQVVIKTFTAFKSDKHAMSRTILALEKAIEFNVDIINYSASGVGFSSREAQAINKAIDKGIIVVVAAGNDKKDLSKTCDVYPACYNRKIVVVGCKMDNGQKCKHTNYGGPVDIMVNGDKQYGGGYIMTGTSQSTANMTGTIIRDLVKKGKKHVSDLFSL